MNDDAPTERVERCRGSGELVTAERTFQGVRYRITRYQALSASGLPIPGRHRIDGAIDPAGLPAEHLVGESLTLRLEDGRALRVTLADAGGRVLSVGHGPSRCGCC